MCESNKRFFGYLFLASLFVLAAAALRAEEAGPWFLISETELRSIENYREQSEAEKRSWLLQARELKAQANSLLTASETLNSQLARAREANRKLEQSYNESEAEWLTRLSLKNGEIAGLKQALADQTLEAESHKGKAALRLVIIIALLTAIAAYIAFKILRFFRVIPL
ncbi:MAG: hypothetical protein LBH57_04350 [Treponema sp.]|jgi:hypothetical protein|nr:hypothetical protein [Treponema sp.]